MTRRDLFPVTFRAHHSPSSCRLASTVTYIPGTGAFLILERDNQGGPDAWVKRIYYVDLLNSTPGGLLGKSLVIDLLDGLSFFTQGLVPEKLEGLAFTEDGNLFLMNDNDGVDDNNGATYLWNLSEMDYDSEQ